MPEGRITYTACSPSNSPVGKAVVRDEECDESRPDSPGAPKKDAAKTIKLVEFLPSPNPCEKKVAEMKWKRDEKRANARRAIDHWKIRQSERARRSSRDTIADAENAYGTGKGRSTKGASRSSDKHGTRDEGGYGKDSRSKGYRRAKIRSREDYYSKGYHSKEHCETSDWHEYESHEREYYGKGYPGQGTRDQGYDRREYDEQRYNGDDYYAGSCNGGEYDEWSYTRHDYDEQRYNRDDYRDNGYGHEYRQSGYGGQDYHENGYGGQDYHENGYKAEEYRDNGYKAEEYYENGYKSENYQDGYSRGQNHEWRESWAY